MKRTYTLISIFLFLLPVAAIAQADIHFSQFYENNLLRNPALLGVTTNNYRVIGYYRNQWSSIANPYETFLVNGEYRITLSRNSDDYLSLGLLGYSDKAGDLNQKITAFYPAVNFNKSLNTDNNSYLSFGFTGGYVQYSFDPTKATFDNQFQNGDYDPGNPTYENLPVPKRSLGDLGAGINYNVTPGRSTYLFGVSTYHFTRPRFSYYESNAYAAYARLNVNASMAREMNDNVVVLLHGNYSTQGKFHELMGALLLGWKNYSAAYSQPDFEIYGGIIARNRDAIAPIVKIKYKHMAGGISYDVNTSRLKKASNMQGGFEMTLSVTGNYPKNPNMFKKAVCPQF